MYLPVAPLLLFTSLISAAPIAPAKRDAQTITYVLTETGNALNSLTNSLNALARSSPRDSSGTFYQDGVEKGAAAVTRIMSSGARQIRGLKTLSLMEATATVSAANNAQSAQRKCTQAWLNARTTIMRFNGGREAALRMLRSNERAADELMQAITSKMPMLGQPVNQFLGLEAKMGVRQAIDAYSSGW